MDTREPDILRVLVRLEDICPVYPVKLITPGTPVEIVSGQFNGFVGYVRENPWGEDKPFTVVVEEPVL